ncbi:MAG: DUF2490 domain-containing protein [Paludibacteraceae bacterium]|nr:DUF2490 domain-containing protein [Paludibacteraceae bacterium]
MKRFFHIFALLSLLLILTQPLQADDGGIKSDSTLTRHALELRVSAAYAHTFKRIPVTIGVEEEIRSTMYAKESMQAYVPSSVDLTVNPAVTRTFDPYFKKSYTTVEVSYKPIKYFSISAGYTLKLLGDKGWSDVNKFLRHRVSVALTGQVKIRQWKLSLRERLDIDMRRDSVNSNEKNKTDLTLRHRLHADYTMRSRPLKFYTNLELLHTLNAPTTYLNNNRTYKNYYTSTGDNASAKRFGQYITAIRPTLGLKWRLDKRNTLCFYYTFSYEHDRDINITKSKQRIEIVRETEYRHIIGIAYEFQD